MSTLGALVDEFKVYIGAGVVAALGAMRMRKKLASDNVDVATDHERRRWVDGIVAERDELVKEVRALREHLAANAAELGRLGARVESLLADVERLTRDADRRHSARPHDTDRRSPP